MEMRTERWRAGMGMGSGVLQGYRVRLRPIEPDDTMSHYPWDQGGAPWFPGAGGRERSPRWSDTPPRPGREGDAVQFLVETLEGEHAGIIGTHDCDRRNGTFSYGIAIREACQRHGYGAEAILLACRYYFEELRYQKVSTGVYSFNESSLRLHERLGFECEGCLRRMVYSGGQFYDRVVFGLTAEEFAARHATSLPKANA